MGKSLSLLSLIVHTLDYARSSGRCTEAHNPALQGGLSSGATLIVTPKSSQYWDLRNPNPFVFNRSLI